jgi:hypothetical protein
VQEEAPGWDAVSGRHVSHGQLSARAPATTTATAQLPDGGFRLPGRLRHDLLPAGLPGVLPRCDEQRLLPSWVSQLL